MAGAPTGRQAAWQLEGSSADLYQRSLVPAVTAVWAADLVPAAAITPGDRVLDVACGTGVVARLAAEAAGPRGQVTGLDLNADMLRVARSLPPPAGAPVDWVEGSALAMALPDGAFNDVLCQLGLQFMPDRPRALAEMRRVLAEGGRVAISVYAEIERNPATNALSAALDRHLGVGASLAKRTEHVLGDASVLREEVSAAGFREPSIVTLERRIRFPSVADYVAIQTTGTPLAALFADMAPAERARLVGAIVEELAASLASFVSVVGASAGAAPVFIPPVAQQCARRADPQRGFAR